MTELIVADASPLIVLARVGHLKTLALVAGEVIVPNAVEFECVRDLSRPGAREISQAFAQGVLTRQPRLMKYEPLIAVGLGPGESAAISLALVLSATILIDERQGRQAALARSLKVIGTVGILLVAKDRAIISSIAPIIDSLKEVGFFIAPALEREVLRRAGETTR